MYIFEPQFVHQTNKSFSNVIALFAYLTYLPTANANSISIYAIQRKQKKTKNFNKKETKKEPLKLRIEPSFLVVKAINRPKTVSTSFQEHQSVQKPNKTKNNKKKKKNKVIANELKNVSHNKN